MSDSCLTRVGLVSPSFPFRVSRFCLTSAIKARVDASKSLVDVAGCMQAGYVVSVSSKFL